MQLIEVKSFSCYRDSKGKWRGTIADRKYNLVGLNFSITDPVTLEKLNRNVSLSNHCLLCLSLGRPWQPDPSQPMLCYRLIAGVIELLPELQLISKEMEKLSSSTEQGREYLREKFGKISRYQLTETEAKQFLVFLKNGGKVL